MDSPASVVVGVASDGEASTRAPGAPKSLRSPQTVVIERSSWVGPMPEGMRHNRTTDRTNHDQLDHTDDAVEGARPPRHEMRATARDE